MFAAFAIVPQFVEQPRSTGYGYGASVIGAGLYLMPAAVTMALLGPLAGRIEHRIGSKTALMLGGAFGTAGFALVAISHGVHWHIYAAMGIVGIGLGLGFAALPNLIVTAVPQEQTGAATGINTIMRVLGGAVGHPGLRDDRRAAGRGARRAAAPNRVHGVVLGLRARAGRRLSGRGDGAGPSRRGVPGPRVDRRLTKQTLVFHVEGPLALQQLAPE